MQDEKQTSEQNLKEIKKTSIDESLAHVEIPDLSSYEFPVDYDAFEDENLDMIP